VREFKNFTASLCSVFDSLTNRLISALRSFAVVWDSKDFHTGGIFATFRSLLSTRLNINQGKEIDYPYSFGLFNF